MFLENTKNPAQAVDSKYIFKKLCNGVLEKSNEELVYAAGDFALYKRRHLFYKEKQMTPVQVAHVKPNSAGQAVLSEEEPVRNATVPSEEMSEQEAGKERAILDTIGAAHLEELLEELNNDGGNVQ
jgi:hypothetical protein